MISISDLGEGMDTIKGDILAGLSAIFYGVYTVFLTYRIPDDDALKMPMFFAFVGFCNMLIGLPCLAIMHFSGLEPFNFPPNMNIML